MNVALLARRAVRNGFPTTTRVSQPVRRRYATERPTLPEGNSNRTFIIAAMVGVPALAYFIIPSRGGNAKPASRPTEATRSPNLDPAAQKRYRDEHEPDQKKYLHPEHKDPETYKAPFGQLHQPKRVDSPPDNRHHQSLNDRARQYD